MPVHLLGILLACAAFFDFQSRRIPNRLNWIGLLVTSIAVFTQTYVAMVRGDAAIASSIASHAVLGCAAAILIGSALYFSGGIGGGDFKLFAVAGVCLGPVSVCQFLLFSLSLAALTALALTISGSRKEALRLPLAPFLLVTFVAIEFGGLK